MIPRTFAAALVLLLVGAAAVQAQPATSNPAIQVAAPAAGIPNPFAVLVSDLAAGNGAAASLAATTAVPSTFRALSVTFVSPMEGWVLGSVPCGGHHCPDLAHTTNGGHTWSLLAGPPTIVNSLPGSPEAAHGVSGLRFADHLNGWAFGPELWATHDGGHSWTLEDVFGGHGGPILELEAAHGVANAVLFDEGTNFRIATSPAASDDWAVVHQALPIGAGPIPTVQIVLSGAAGWIVQDDRTVINGARLLSGVWHSWRPACASVVGPALIAASSALNMAAVCDVGLFSTPTGDHLSVSHNGGSSFSAVGGALPVMDASALATPGTSTMVVAGIHGSSMVLIASFDGGHTWHTVLSLGSGSAADLGFTTATQGVVVSAGHLYMTHDGGHTWVHVTL